jgi:two-component system response regulator ResD
MVLVVDDEALDREMMRRALEFSNRYRVMTAADYDEALGLFLRNGDGIDLALLDVTLPGKNGVELAKELLQRNSDLPVLFTSGHVGASVIRFYGLAASERHFLQKPFDAATLLSRVEQTLTSPERLVLVLSAASKAPDQT